jgi:hypothetical protein
MVLLQWLDWFIKVGNPVTFWIAQPTYVLEAVVFLLGGAGNLVHGELIPPNIFWLKITLIFTVLVKTIVAVEVNVHRFGKN